MGEKSVIVGAREGEWLEDGHGTRERAAQALARGDNPACLAACEAFLAQFPADVEALRLKGLAFLRQGRRLPGAQALARALGLAPAHLSLRLDVARALEEIGNPDGAALVLRQGLAHHPGSAELALRLAPLLSRSGRSAEAQAVLEAAVANSPRRADLRNLLGTEYSADLRLDDGIAQLAVADFLAPESSVTLCNLGILHQARGDLEGAERYYERAIARAPDNALPRFNLGTVRLTRLDWTRGFAGWEWRLRRPDARIMPDLPVWRGEPLDGRRVLVLSEQGYGDVIQFARFLPRLAERGGEVLVEAPTALRALIARIPGVAACPPFGHVPAGIDCVVPLASLPFALGCGDTSELAGPVPYLMPPPDRHVALDDGGDDRRFKVGVTWAPKPTPGPGYALRSLTRRAMPVDLLARLTGLPGIRFYGLQKGGAGDAAAVGVSAAPGLIDLAPRLGDFADTAAVLARLDLVITVDTAVAHLAGAMGRPVWLLLSPGQADYRWGVGAESSPWYPQMRLFRANAAGWPALVATVVAELEAVARGRGRLYPPPAWGWSPPREASE